MRFSSFLNAAGPVDRPEAQVHIHPQSETGLPVSLIEAAEAGLDFAEWARRRKGWIAEQLYASGGLLFRGFAVCEASEFERGVRAVATTGELMNYVENTSPRTTVLGNVKTSTDHPAHEEIVLHNEHSFSNVFPAKLFLCCRMPPETGGETPLADCRRIMAKLPAAIRKRFGDKGGYLYVRNFGAGFGPSWQTVFQKQSRTELEEYLRACDIGFEWRDGDRLRISYRRPVEATHPVTGKLCWFNHVLFWHVSSLRSEVKEVLLHSFDEQDLPNQSFYGDGSSIEADVIEEIRSVYAEEASWTAWHPGDLLLIDNVLMAHGRRPYTGKRLILFAMADPWTRADIGPL